MVTAKLVIISERTKSKWDLTSTSHPGRGVYRSSYMNARRLAATEANIAYRTADHLRWQKMDFVVGIEIVLSNNHTIRLQPGEKTSDLPGQMRADGTPKANAVRTLTDICDTLAGRYPKDFKFTGWHPHCRCRAVTILKTEEEMARDTKRILDGRQPSADSANAVTDTPEAFKGWVENNRDRIATGHSLPYFIRDNAKYTGITAKPARASSTTLGIAAERHAKRTIAQIQDIKRRYWERFEPDYLTDEQKLANIEAYLQIEKDLGIKRGRPMSHEQANKMHGNLYYGESKAYSVNCQTCVVAYELRLRGFDVSALPNTADSALSKLSKATHTAWQGITREDILVIAKTTLDKYGHIKQPPLKWVKVSAAMTETGRYHIAWRWKRKRSGHIITAERLPDGSLRFYDPQNGMSGALDLYKKEIAGNIRIYRVDNLAPNANIVKDVLAKGETKAAAGTAAQGGISGGITPANKTEWKELRKQAKREAKGYTPGIRYDKERFYTHNYTMSKNERNCKLTHCYTDDEVKAVKQIPQLLHKLGKPRYEPLNTRRPNYRKKIERGAIHFVAYEIEINGKTFEFKTVVIKNNHKYVVEHPYSLKEKK